MRKGQLTVNTIVIAALALVVLVVLFGIFTGQMGNWVEKIKNVLGYGEEQKYCNEQEGFKCVYAKECPSKGTAKAGEWLDCFGGVCCPTQ
ncbi:hypothetical protein HZA97_06445 [Candidatus Woesearchaeota archaeon]|nr:hypothetical protein [Candidatus Woesearchaeota archaeon]